MLEQFLKFGVDIRIEPMEVAPTAHHIMGGLKITPECKTTLPGLFACGESAGGVQGANRLGGNALADTQVFGKRAGEFSARQEKRQKKSTRHRFPDRKSGFTGSFQGPKTRPQSGRKSSVKCGKGPGFPGRGGTQTYTCGRQTGSCRPRSRRCRQKTSRTAALVENMCLTASLICRSALIRPESRGAHMRVDIAQEWDAAHSPYGHTFIAKNREGIEKRKVTA